MRTRQNQAWNFFCTLCVRRSIFIIPLATLIGLFIAPFVSALHFVLLLLLFKLFAVVVYVAVVVVVVAAVVNVTVVAAAAVVVAIVAADVVASIFLSCFLAGAMMAKDPKLNPKIEGFTFADGACKRFSLKTNNKCLVLYGNSV